MSAPSLLVELLVEELPPKALRTLGEAFASMLRASLESQGLLGAQSALTAFASPRRLAAHLTKVAAKATDRAVQQKLMPVGVALNNAGQPTPALLKKLAALGFDATAVPSLKRAPDGKTEALFLDNVVAGATLAEALAKALQEALAKLPIPKVMAYQLADGWTTVNFVRPAHGLVALHGDEVVPVAILGLHAGRSTQGHRFEASTPTIELRNADTYAGQLEDEGAVLASFDARRTEITHQLHAAAAAQNLKCIDDDALLDEVTALVERPNVLACEFEAEFLEVPQECLILTMKANQKYFPLLDAADQLTNQFLVVSNVRPADPSRVVQGNERVIRPRLADAKFFFDQDRRQSLESRIPKLGSIVYHHRLGSQLQRVERVQQLARFIGKQLGGDTAEKAAAAARIAKSDLVTGMVGEFPELQGVMGRYYALADGLEAEIAAAIREQYLPRGAGDELPATQAGIALALADKIETLVGIFRVGQKPTGAKDPFGLRRAAIGVLRILLERKLPLDLVALLEFADRQLPVDLDDQGLGQIYDYIMERLRAHYLEDGAQVTVTTEMFDAVLASRPVSPLDFDARLRAFERFLQLTDAHSLTAANKRISNILKKADAATHASVQKELLNEPAERALYEAIERAEHDAAPLFASANYGDALARLASLRPAVDKFFDDVMVMTEDERVRANRLALLSRLRTVFLQVADLSRLPG